MPRLLQLISGTWLFLGRSHGQGCKRHVEHACVGSACWGQLKARVRLGKVEKVGKVQVMAHNLFNVHGPT